MTAFLLDPDIVFLNHGSFGACPSPVMDAQAELRTRQERDPVHFFSEELEGLLDLARASIAELVGAEAEDIALVPNATHGANTVLAALDLSAGDEIVITNHGYNAVNNAARRWASRSNAQVAVAQIPFPIASADQATDAIVHAVTSRTKLVIVDHITSPTALVLPVRDMVRALADRGIDVLIDGAHAPGMIELSLRDLGAAYYTGNLHKWVCAPKGAAFLHVRRDRQHLIEPLSTSHGFNSSRTDRSRFLLQLNWTGTADPSSMLVVPNAIQHLQGLHEDGIVGVMRANRALALEARSHLSNVLGVALPCPDTMIGSMASLPIADRPASARVRSSLFYTEPLHDALYERHRIQVPIPPWPAPPKRLVRISAQRYNSLEQYELLGKALLEELARERASSMSA